MGRGFPLVQTGPGAHPASCTMGTGSFPWVKYGRGLLLTTNPLLVPWSWKSRAISLPTLRATTGPVTGTLLLGLSAVSVIPPLPHILAHATRHIISPVGDIAKYNARSDGVTSQNIISFIFTARE